MRHFRPQALALMLGTALAGALVAWWNLRVPLAATREQWLAFALFTPLAALAFLFPIRPTRDGPAFVLASAFVFAGVLTMPAGLLTLMVALSSLPWALMDRRDGKWVRAAFNAAHVLLGAQVAIILVGVKGAGDLTGPADLLWLLAAVGADVLVGVVLVVLTVALNSGIPFRQVQGFDARTVAADAVIPVLGVLTAVLWRVNPWALPLALLPLALVYWLMNGIHMVRLASVDPKTGLYNYRHFERALWDELVRSKAAGRPVSLLFCDLDFLREVNNRYGHLAGDAVLRQLAQVLSQHTRPGDLVARFGGEEFVVILPNTPLEMAAYIADRLRKAVADYAYNVGRAEAVRCTVSIGVASAPDHGWAPDALVHLADQAMYLAKELGRNRVCTAVPGNLPDLGGQTPPGGAGARSGCWRPLPP